MQFIAARPEPLDLIAFYAQNFVEPIHLRCAFFKAESCRLHAGARMACCRR
jgi:hypothetical protein